MSDVENATRRTHRMFSRPWACPLHRGVLEEPSECKFFEIGLPRTASRSVAEAAKLLGVNAIHGFANCKQCKDDFVFRHLKNDVNLDIYRVYDYCGQLALTHWKQLARERPEAKFILTTRPIDSWCKSFRLHVQTAHCFHTESDPAYDILHRVLYGHHPDKFWKEVKILETIYREYTEEIIGYFKGTDRLLVLNVWEMTSLVLWYNLALFLNVGLDWVDFEIYEPFPKQIKPVRLYRWLNRFGE